MNILFLFSKLLEGHQKHKREARRCSSALGRGGKAGPGGLPLASTSTDVEIPAGLVKVEPGEQEEVEAITQEALSSVSIPIRKTLMGPYTFVSVNSADEPQDDTYHGWIRPFDKEVTDL